ncbi:hypothetical protein H6B07_18390 [Mediterraneibacter glycyrrhizinilyticus]|nr:hypothetical protein [Mediterraneibacter glycyrrhizinilyticus]
MGLKTNPEGEVPAEWHTAFTMDDGTELDAKGEYCSEMPEDFQKKAVEAVGRILRDVWRKEVSLYAFFIWENCLPGMKKHD